MVRDRRLIHHHMKSFGDVGGTGAIILMRGGGGGGGGWVVYAAAGMQECRNEVPHHGYNSSKKENRM